MPPAAESTPPHADPRRPDGFGLSPIQTLAYVADPRPAHEHLVFWRHFRSVLMQRRPTLARREPGGSGLAEQDPTDTTATHAFESLTLDGVWDDHGSARIGARLLMPPPGVTPTAGLVCTHGYAASAPVSDGDRQFAPLLEKGVAVLRVRVRGFGGSRLDTGDLTEPDPSADPTLGVAHGWITRGLPPSPIDAGSPGAPAAIMRWVYPQAVADVCNGVRALRWHLEAITGTRPRMLVHGESFGGGLAIAAIAILQGRERPRTDVDRAVIALPTMGDWHWRLSDDGSPGAGSGREVADLVTSLQAAGRGADAEQVRTRLRLCDSVVLAGRVRCPVLCKLAVRDEVVPAPTAAAVYNALVTDPSQRWRFVVPDGHAQTGVANDRRHAEFERLMNRYLDPAGEPAEILESERDRPDGAHGGGDETITSAGGPHPAHQATLFTGEPGLGDEPEAASPRLTADETLLADAYAEAGRTLDDLPYTDEFEGLWSTVSPAIGGPPRRDVFHALHTMRKAGKLPRLGRSAGKAVAIPPEFEPVLIGMVEARVEKLGKRDQLPFTAAFDALCEEFNTAAELRLSPHEVWRVICKLAKSGEGGTA